MMSENTGLSAGDVIALTGNRNNDGMWGDGSWLFALIALALIGGWGNGFGFGNGFGGFGGGFGFPGYGYGGAPVIINSGNDGNCGRSACATQADLAAGFNNSAVLGSLNDIKLGQAGIQQTLCQGFNGINTTVLQGFNGVDNAICTLGYQNQAGFNSLGSQIAACCCDTQRSIDNVRYDLATQACDTRNTIQNSTRDILENQNTNARAILDFLTQDKINTLQAENTSLKFAASQAKQNDFITAVGNSIVSRLETPSPVPSYSVFPPTPVYVGNPYALNNFGCNSGCGC